MPEIQIPEPIFLERLGGDEIYGFGQDGNVTITADTTLSRDMYYESLTINANCTLDTNGYKIFVKDTLTFTDSTSRIGRFTSKTTVGTLKGGFTKGTSATDTLGGKSGEELTKIVTHNGTDFVIDGTANATVELEIGYEYEFNLKSDTNQTHPTTSPFTQVKHNLKFSETSDGTHNSGTEYTTGVTVAGTAGTDMTVKINVTDSTPTTLYYYNENFSGHGGQINIVSQSTSNQFFSGENEFFNLNTAIAGIKFDQATGTFKALGGGSGGADSTEIEAASDGDAGYDTNYSSRNTVGGSGGKGATGNAATNGVGAVGGGVVVIAAKNVSGNGTIRADGDDSTAATQGTVGAPAPDGSTSGNTNPTNYGANYGSNSGSNPTNYGSNPTNYGSNNPSPYSYPGNAGFAHQHYHFHPAGFNINNTPAGNTHYHYNHYHPGNPTNYGANPGNPYSYSGNPYSYPGNNYSYGYSYGYSYPGNTNASTPHPGGRGGRGQKVTDGYNGGGGTVLLVTGTKPLPGSLTLAAASGTGGSSIASAGTVVTVFNISVSDTDPGA
jgi:hypothetical protein